jgi:hypothetical protein
VDHLILTLNSIQPVTELARITAPRISWHNAAEIGQLKLMRNGLAWERSCRTRYAASSIALVRLVARTSLSQSQSTLDYHAGVELF